VVIPNKVFNLEFMPLFLVEHLVVALIQNHPNGNATKKVPNPNFFDKLLTFIDNDAQKNRSRKRLQFF
jgi:hypothetical protein